MENRVFGRDYVMRFSEDVSGVLILKNLQVGAQGNEFRCDGPDVEIMDVHHSRYLGQRFVYASDIQVRRRAFHENMK